MHDMLKQVTHTVYKYFVVSFYFRNLTVMKARLKGARKGHSLLKKKADALKIRLHSILKQIIEVSFQYKVEISLLTMSF